MKKSSLALLVLMTTLLLPHIAGSDVELRRSVVGNGGNRLGSGDHILSCTLGQAVIGLAGPTYINEMGFWYQYESIYSGMESLESVVAHKYWFGENRPNPFNLSTMLRFSIGKRCRVRIRLYDVNGREVRTVVDEDLDPGTHNRVLDGAGLSSGVYFCSMQADRFEATRKFVLLK